MVSMIRYIQITYQMLNIGNQKITLSERTAKNWTALTMKDPLVAGHVAPEMAYMNMSG